VKGAKKRKRKKRKKNHDFWPKPLGQICHRPSAQAPGFPDPGFRRAEKPPFCVACPPNLRPENPPGGKWHGPWSLGPDSYAIPKARPRGGKRTVRAMVHRPARGRLGGLVFWLGPSPAPRLRFPPGNERLFTPHPAPTFSPPPPRPRSPSFFALIGVGGGGFYFRGPNRRSRTSSRKKP